MTVTRRGRFAIRGVERSRLWAGPAAGKREPQDRSLHHPQLLGERTGVVGEAVALADVLHARRDLAIAAARHVGKEVMLDLIAEIPARHVEERAALDVGGADQLANVPTAPRLILDLLRCEGVRLVGEMAAEDDRVGPDVSHEIGRDVRPDGAAKRRPSLAQGPARRLRDALAA